jgi:hypothetical protein
MFFKYTEPSKIQNLVKHGNKKLVWYTALLDAKLSIKILTMTQVFSLQFWSFWGIYNQVHKKMTTYVSTRLAF